MPIDYSKYPYNWLSEIRPDALERAGHRCEWCDVENGALIIREPGATHKYRVLLGPGDEYAYADESDKITKVVLTIAHIFDPDPMACHPLNLAALCQRCHLLYDLDHHAWKRRKNRDEAVGQGRMFDP